MPNVLLPPELQEAAEKQVSQEIQPRLPKSVSKHIFETKTKIFGVLGWPLKGPMTMLSWARQKLSQHLPWLKEKTQQLFSSEQEPGVMTPALLDEEEEALESIPRASLTPEEKTHQRGILTRFQSLYNDYRSSHGLDSLQATMNEKAERIVYEQTQHREVIHTSPEKLRQRGIGAEIITAGFSTPEEALENFIHSPKHARALMSQTYTDMGVALRQGEMVQRDKKGEIISVQPVYYLVVVYDEDGKLVEEGTDIPEGPIPGDRRPTDFPDFKWLNAVAMDRPWLAKLLDSAQEDAEQKGYELSLNKELTENPPENATEKQRERFEADRRKGAFFITLKDSSGQEAHYKVYDSPPQLLRKGRSGETYKTVSIPFSELITDFEGAIA